MISVKAGNSAPATASDGDEASQSCVVRTEPAGRNLSRRHLGIISCAASALCALRGNAKVIDTPSQFLSTMRAAAAVPCQALPQLKCVPGAPGPNTILVDAFGIDGYVEEGSPNSLSAGVDWSIENDGAETAQGPYSVMLTIRHMALVAGGGAATLVEGKILARCSVSGPTLAPGATATVRFTPSKCTPNLPAALPCGLYEETLTIDPNKQLKQSSRNGNICRRYLYVPSKIKKITITVVPNPDNDPAMQVTPQNGVNVIAPLMRPNFPVRAFRVVISSVPPGQSFSVAYQKHVAGAQAGDFADMKNIAPPGGLLLKFVKPPVTLDYIVTVPKPNFASAPCTNIGPPPYYEEKLDDILTCMSKEGPGCVLAQKTLQLSVLHECR